MFVREREVKVLGYIDQVGLVVGCGGMWASRGVERWGRGGFRVLAAHDKVRWDMGFLDVGGGRERQDARWGAMWCAGPVEGVFL
jgi:hypothetical protein